MGSGAGWSSSALVEGLMTAAGLVMMLTPLALWIVPDITSFKLVLAVCGVACWIVVLLARLDREGRDRTEGRPAEPLAALSPETIERLQNAGEMRRRRPDPLRRSFDRSGEP